MRVKVLEFYIDVLAAMRLIAKDRNVFGIRTSSDPYVIVRFWPKGKDTDDGSPIDVGECEPIMANLNPVWNYRCNKITIPADMITARSVFEIVVMDYDLVTSDDDMGSAIIPAATAMNVKQWYRVKDKHGGKAGEVQCEIKIRESFGFPAIEIKPRTRDDGSFTTLKNAKADQFAPCTQRIMDRNHSRRRRFAPVL